jgi:hypothetical protein
MQITSYISGKYDIEESDLWIRHRGAHDLTDSGLLWEYVRPTDTIQDTKEIEIDVVDLRYLNRYIVALLHDEESKESPMILSKCGTPHRQSIVYS